jgi:two-component system, OmpR family, response regulator CpxR
MSVIGMFSSVFCNAEHVADQVQASTGLKALSDADVVSAAHNLSGIAVDKIRRAFWAKPSLFNKFTHEKEASIAYLRLALASLMTQDNLIICGFTAHLIPATISHLLRVALIANMDYRLAAAAENEGLAEKEALKRLRNHDENCATWVDFLYRKSVECWDPKLYDLVIPMNKTTVEHASALIQENILKNVVRTTAASRKAVDDFRLATQVEVTLVEEGHHVEVTARNGAVTLGIHKRVLLLSRLEDELRSIASNVYGVESVAVEISRDNQQANIYSKHDFNLPDRVLLVDDERELAQTLSERLQLRDMGTAVAFDGESALKLVKEDEPEVVIIDLKLPGIDGLEVLRKVKQIRPEIEVIILTGQGSPADEEQCRRLGAFGYLQKPVDIEKLSELIKDAHMRIHYRR